MKISVLMAGVLALSLPILTAAAQTYDPYNPAGAGGSNSSGSNVGTAAAAPAMTMDSPKGKILADAKGLTLYTYDKDEKDKSNCVDSCGANWLVLKASATDKPSGDWNVVDGPGGIKIWSYKGKPLYQYVKDTKAGDMTGDGVAGVWHVAVVGTDQSQQGVYDNYR